MYTFMSMGQARRGVVSLSDDGGVMLQRRSGWFRSYRWVISHATCVKATP